VRVLRSEEHVSPHTYREAIPQGGDAADGEQRVVGGVEGGELHGGWWNILFGLGMGGGIGTGERDRNIRNGWVVASGLPNRWLLDVQRFFFECCM